MVSRLLTPFGGRTVPEDRGDSFLELPRELNSHEDGMPEGTARITPQLDVYEENGQIEVTAELPGVAQSEIEVCLEGDVLTISGEKRHANKEQRSHFVERSYGVFKRSIQLPFAPDPGSVKAQNFNGVLSIRFPRIEQERSHRIEINGESSPNESQAIGQGWTGTKPDDADRAKSYEAPLELNKPAF